MTLPTELFEELIGGEGIRLEDRGHDRRGAERVPVRLRAAILRGTAGRYGAPEATRLREISVTGVGLMHASPIRPGETFALAIKSPKGRPIGIVCEAVRGQAVSPKLSLVGARFIRLIDPAALAASAARATESAPSRPGMSNAAAAKAVAATAATEPAGDPIPAALAAEIERVRRAVFS